MANDLYGAVLTGNEAAIRRAYDKWAQQPVDQEMTADGTPFDPRQTTLARAASVTGPGTFFRRAQRTLTFEPTAEKGWWFKRDDLPFALPILVSVNNVWTAARNIVLRSGSPHNYMRMVEHIVALKVGLGLDNVTIRMTSGDPPLFDRGSMDLVETVDAAGVAPLQTPAGYVTVKGPVTMGGPNGSFLTFLPAEGDSRRLVLDCAIDFPSAIGRQRIRFVVNPEAFRHGALARTNTTFGMMLFCKTIGLLFADTRNMGYTTRNILVAGPCRYFNEPRLFHNGKSLEAAWHRAALDLLAAIALIDRGRLAGTVVSYKSGHGLDTRMIGELYRRSLLRDLPA